MMKISLRKKQEKFILYTICSAHCVSLLTLWRFSRTVIYAEKGTALPADDSDEPAPAH